MSSLLEIIRIPIKLVFQAFFSFIKVLFILLVLTVGTLVAGQSSVAPVSMHLITSYGMEYAITYLKPYRHFFPEPFLIDLDVENEE